MTLLELLLVVFILSMLAFSATSITNNVDKQFRYEETQRRLEQIRHAILGDPQLVADGQRVLSGYVADVGTLPSNIDELTGTTSNFGLKTPVFDPEPAANGLNDGPAPGSDEDGAEVALEEHRLAKGFRGGYLQLRPKANRFRDGWGNVSADSSDDALNHGWAVEDPTPTTLRISSLGSDNDSADPETDYRDDIPVTIAPNDWSLDVTTVEIKVSKASRGSTNKLRASLLVYVNGSWRRFTTSEAIEVDGKDPPEEMTFDPEVDGWPVDENDQKITRLPIGRHVVVLVEDDGDSEINNGESLFDADDDPTNGMQPSARATVFPRTTPDPVKLVIP